MSILQKIRDLKNSTLLAVGLTAGVAGTSLTSCGDKNAIKDETNNIIPEKEYLVRVEDRFGGNDSYDLAITLHFINENVTKTVDTKSENFDKLLNGKTYKISFSENPFLDYTSAANDFPNITNIVEVDKGKTVAEVNDSLRVANSKLQQQNDSLKAVISGQGLNK